MRGGEHINTHAFNLQLACNAYACSIHMNAYVCMHMNAEFSPSRMMVAMNFLVSFRFSGFRSSTMMVMAAVSGMPNEMKTNMATDRDNTFVRKKLSHDIYGAMTITFPRLPNCLHHRLHTHAEFACSILFRGVCKPYMQGMFLEKFLVTCGYIKAPHSVSTQQNTPETTAGVNHFQ